MTRIVELLADDRLGAQREDFKDPLPEAYFEAFEAIDGNPYNELVVAEEETGIIGTLQLTFIPSLTYQGGLRAQIEAVRVDKAYRSKGIGKRLFEWAIERAREKGCHVVQLTTNKTRDRAYDFYESLGFEASHEGMKLFI